MCYLAGFRDCMRAPKGAEMIRVRKPIRLLEWGAGTNTTNQIWSIAGEGKISRYEMRNGVTTLYVELGGQFKKTNENDNSLKIAQPGEGMTMNSTHWGEVAMGVVKAVESGGRRVLIEITTATKIDNRKHD
jgi:hypothetical protein